MDGGSTGEVRALITGMEAALLLGQAAWARARVDCFVAHRGAAGTAHKALPAGRAVLDDQAAPQGHGDGIGRLGNAERCRRGSVNAGAGTPGVSGEFAALRRSVAARVELEDQQLVAGQGAPASLRGVLHVNLQFQYRCSRRSSPQHGACGCPIYARGGPPDGYR